MPHSANHRHWAGGHSPGYGLLVKNPQLLQGSASPGYHNDINFAVAQALQSAHHAGGTSVSLDSSRSQDQGGRPTLAGSSDDKILQGCTLGRSDQADAAGKFGQWQFCLLGKYALLVQLLFELGKSQGESALACWFHCIYIELVIPALFVHRYIAPDIYTLAVLRHKGQPSIPGLEHDTLDAAGLILECKIHMARPVMNKIGQFPFHSYIHQARIVAQGLADVLS